MKTKKEALLRRIRICCQDIRIECTQLIMKSGKREITEGIELSYQEKI